MADFEYFEPASIKEAVALLSKYRGEARVIAGGTDILVKTRQGKISPRYVLNLSAIPGLDYINYDAQAGLKLGAMVTIRALEQSAVLQEKYPVISQAAGQLGHIAIRNIATLGGNLCNAVPSAEMAPCLVVLSARAKLVGPDGERTVPLEEFFISSGKTALGEAELMAEIQVPALPANTRATYLRHTAMAAGLPIVNVAVMASLEPESQICRDIKIVVGNVAPTPMRAHQAEAVLRGKKIDQTLMEKSAQAAADEAHPRPGSVRASAEYKKDMTRVFTRRALMAVTT